MILGDSLQVMASLAEREGLRGKVQCIYIDPPYGIKFNSNFQWSTTDKSGTTTDSADSISREPEQVKAFRDTWRDGIHSYLTYLRERLTVARDLLTVSGSVFVQIGDENVHRVRAMMDEILGEDNFIALIPFRKKTMPFGSKFIEQMADFILWYGKAKTDSQGNANTKYRKQYLLRSVEGEFHHCWYEKGDGTRTRMSKHQLYNHALLPPKSRVYRLKSLEPSGRMDSGMFDYKFRGKLYQHPKNGFGTTQVGLRQIEKSNRLEPEGNRLCYVLYADEGESSQMTAPWFDTVGADNKQYVVQTNTEVVKRCIL
ncbi:MAG: site-specific DNA-methyltransferase, partial [Chloroflexi bacterium]